ncbi:rhodanese-like domain-containing protein [Changchengzhania lutea]|uniref:rhodanese-like domain-containing protein n=1 Tax=Changchengzhania lutea TaxID=2049305 RepID=UPI00115CCBEE|nr:rhodanese-like domain-containing protein [Changchengzhania lutea]
MGILDIFFGNKNDKINDFLSRDAIIIDVRSEREYKSGAIVGSKNVPLHHLNDNIDVLKKLNKPVITCCASGMRSNKAAKVLIIHNIEAINGGGWARLKEKL